MAGPALNGAPDMAKVAEAHGVTFVEALHVWVRVAMLSFGGPAGQIGVMHRILVEEKRWIGEARFLHALNYCMLLPGPEAQQLAIYLGWLLHKTRGGLVAGTLFVLPGFLSILALSYLYVLVGDLAAIAGLFFGLKAAVLAIVIQAVIRIGKRALSNAALFWLAVAAFVAIFFYDVPFPVIILTAAMIGFLGTRAGLAWFGPGKGHGENGKAALADADSALGQATPAHARPNLSWSLKIASIFLLLWLVPVLGLNFYWGEDNVFSKIAVFFSQLAVLTFGGAYAVLAYVAQEAVQYHGWLAPGEMLDGLGMAETTPGPLIQVVQFVGFLGASRNPGVLDPLLAGFLGAVLTTWVTFVPCFLWIFLGAPFIESLRENRALSGGLSAITAAVTGVILNLSIWFALHVVFAAVRPWSGMGITLDIPVWATLDLPALVLVLCAVGLVFRLKAGMFTTLAFCSLAGVAWKTLAVG